MGEAPAFSAIMVQLFEGTCYMTPLLGAWLADSHWGRYKTILVFSSIYMLVRHRCRQNTTSTA
jgi:dipeptide/tripeptide permease